MSDKKTAPKAFGIAIILSFALILAVQVFDVDLRQMWTSIKDASIFRAGMDTDVDGLPDDWEVEYFGNLDQDAKGDFDGDGKSNAHECNPEFDFTISEELGRKVAAKNTCLPKTDNKWTDPRNWDTDKDKISDGDEFWGRVNVETVQNDDSDTRVAFTDVDTTHPFYDDIIAAQREGIIPEDSIFADQFRPQQPVTRSEMVAFLVAANDLEPRVSATAPFADVSLSYWDAGYLTTARDHDFISYIPADNTFRPSEPATRSEILEFTFTALGLTPVQVDDLQQPPFTDVGLRYWDAPYIVASADMDLIEPFADGTFRPHEQMTRAEAVSLVLRALGKKDAE